MRKQYLVFDAYGTLLKVNSDIPDLTPAQQQQSADIQQLWRTKQLEYTWLRSQMNAFVGFNQVTYDALNYAFTYYQVNDDPLKQAILSIFEKPTAFEDARMFLTRMKSAGYETSILSNGEPDRLFNSVEVAGIDASIDYILSASHVRVFKPNPKVYALATSKLSCEPQDILFFSSNPWDIAGATHFGFRTIWINRGGLPFEELGVQPNQVVKSFEEVNL